MNKEILKRNIEQVIMQPCLFDPRGNNCKAILPNGLSNEGRYIMVKVNTDDISTQFYLTEDNGDSIDYVERIVELLPERFKEHLVTLRHDTWLSYSYVPVFDTDTQEIWDNELSDFYEAKQAWCDKYGCD